MISCCGLSAGVDGDRPSAALPSSPFPSASIPPWVYHHAYHVPLVLHTYTPYTSCTLHDSRTFFFAMHACLCKSNQEFELFLFFLVAASQ